jgi:rhomboid protease GluP
MVEDRLSIGLSNMGYRRIDSNAQGIYLFYRVEENELSIVSVVHAISGREITLEQYEHILDQIKVNFRNSYPHQLRLLGLIFTRNPNEAKSLCAAAKQDSHWIIDLETNRLMIYETQSANFEGLRGMIEQLLAGEQYENPGAQIPNPDYDNMPGQRRIPKSQAPANIQFTLINTAIIVLNIIVFLFTQFVPAFGGRERMIEKGALSWYFVKENNEYYRLLTSMFMHSGWSHLINNMVVLLFVGSSLERAAGRIRYLVIYFGTGIVAAISSISYNMWKEYAHVSFERTTISIGASGAIFGVVGAILFIVIINRGRLNEISTRQMILFVVLSLYSGIINTQIDQAAHIGGFVAGILLAVIIYRRSGYRKPGAGEQA